MCCGIGLVALQWHSSAAVHCIGGCTIRFILLCGYGSRGIGFILLCGYGNSGIGFVVFGGVSCCVVKWGVVVRLIRSVCCNQHKRDMH